VPLDWATMQMNLGATLAKLGEREGGTARLQEAIAAFNACLEVSASVWPGERVQDVRSRRDAASAEIARRAGR
jgi:hypothetical protein